MRKIALLLVGILLLAVPASANEIEAAKRYINALESGSAEEVHPLMADDIIFEDLTWGAVARGKDEVAKVYAAYTGNIHNVRNKIKNAYAFRGTVVVHSTVSGDVALVSDATPEQRTEVAIDVVRMITLENGKITRHIDVGDYQSMMDQVGAAKKQMGLQ